MRTIKTRCLELLEEGPATTADIAIEVYGDDSARSLHSIASHLWQIRRDGVPVREAGRVDGPCGQRRMKLWEIGQP